MPLPFDLPALSRGFATLTPSATAAGARAANAAAAALGALLGLDVSIRARAAPGTARPRRPAGSVALDLTALPAAAILEVDPALVVAMVDALAGGTGAADVATDLTPIEASALELFTLAALDGACSVDGIERALAPRLSRADAEPASPLAVELEIAAGKIAGRGRLLVPAAALRALREPAAPEGPAAATLVPLSVRSGRAAVAPDELDALSQGDVLVLDPAEEGEDALVLPGGSRFAGTLGEAAFLVSEVTMTDLNAQIPVLLEVELARIEVPLCEIARLEPGAALPLGIDRRGMVTLRVGDRAIARGELVDVEGSVGVRILSLAGER